MLSTRQALGCVVSAINGGLSLGNLLGGSCASDMASVVSHVHVGLTTTVGDPEPSAVATALGALREILRDLVGSNTLPRSANIELVNHLVIFLASNTYCSRTEKTTRFSMVT